MPIFGSFSDVVHAVAFIAVSLIITAMLIALHEARREALKAEGGGVDMAKDAPDKIEVMADVQEAHLAAMDRSQYDPDVQSKMLAWGWLQKGPMYGTPDVDVRPLRDADSGDEHSKFDYE